MSLSTFGAIMSFASGMTGHTKNLYQAAIKKTKDPLLKETLQSLLKEEEKNCSLMEQTRRENVTEMILEPIAGLKQEDYEIKVRLSDEADDPDLLKVILFLEEKEIKFFNESSGKVPLPEVSRIFRKIAQKKEKNLTKLKSLTVSEFLKVSS
jgi:rubrerythrin